MFEVLAMDGYARYVWSAFGISLTVLAVTVVLYRQNLARTRQRLLRQAQSRETEQL